MTMPTHQQREMAPFVSWRARRAPQWALNSGLVVGGCDEGRHFRTNVARKVEATGHIGPVTLYDNDAYPSAIFISIF